MNKNNLQHTSILIELGKELYKELIGASWVILGGPTQTNIKEYSEQFGKKIEQLLEVSKGDILPTQFGLKNILSNSRRTFTEYILEIIVGVLSLNHLPNTPAISIELKLGLIQLVNLSINSENGLYNPIEDPQEKKEIEDKLKLIFEKIYTENVLMFWFEKRFIPRKELNLKSEKRSFFFKNYLSKLAHTCFKRCCNILTMELIKMNKTSITVQYSKFVNLHFQNDPLNCYYNNRTGKMKLITHLIVKFSVNKSDYWDEISPQFIKSVPFNLLNIFNHSPFTEIVQMPIIQQSLKTSSLPVLQKKRTFACKNSRQVPKLDLLHFLI